MKKKVLILIVLLFISPLVFSDLGDGLIMYMPYDEGVGQVTHDMSGNGFDGMLYNQSTQSGEIGKWKDPTDSVWTDGKFGSAVSFWNGTFVHTGSGAIIGGKVMDTHVLYEDAYSDPWGDGQDRSFAFWVRRPTDRHIGWGASWVNEWTLHAGTYTPGDESSVDWWVWGDLEYDLIHTRYDEWASPPYSGRNLNTGLSAGGAWEKDNLEYFLGPEFGDGQWHHVAILIDGNPAGGETERFDVSIYCDGVLKTKISESGWGWGHGKMEAFTVGAAQELKGIDMNDDIDDMAVWCRLLTPSEIAFLQTNPLMPTLLQPPVITSPADGGSVAEDASIIWEDGPDGPFNSYDVYIGRSYFEVDSANNNISCSSLQGEVNGDCAVDLDDLKQVADCWLSPASCDPAADLSENGSIELTDFAFLGADWQIIAPFRGNQTSQDFSVADLEIGQTYYLRVDGIKNGVGVAKGTVISFEITPVWKQTEFWNYIGWPEVKQVVNSYQYAQDMYDMGIRHAMDNGDTISNYYWPNGIKVGIYHNPTTPQYAELYKDTPGIWGYHQYDEPKNNSSQPSMAEVASMHQSVYDVDPLHPSYTNLYSSDGLGGGIGALPGYLDSFFDAFTGTCQPEILSYDHYPFRYGLDEHWQNLEIYRQRALDEGIPLFCWSDARQGSGYPGSTDNKNRMRWCNYSRLAYGVKGISWFTSSKIFDFSSDSYGSRTYTKRAEYYDVQEVNAELNRIGGVMWQLTSTAVYHKNEPGGAASYTTELPAGHWVQLGSEDQVLGMFVDDAGTDYAMVCNRSYSVGITATVTFTTAVSSVDVFNEQNGNWEAATVYGSAGSQYVQVPMGAGYGKLLRIN